MNLPFSSLYELALAAQPTSETLQVNPATFKSVLDSLTDLLIQQQIPAVVWAKLPRGSIWQSGIERYSCLHEVGSVYLFKTQRDEVGEETGGVNSAIALDSSLTTQADVDHPTDGVTLNLSPDSPLRRDYFLLIWSTQFRGLVLGHRPRSAQVLKPSTGSFAETTGNHPSASNSERQQQILLLCSFEQPLVEQVLAGVEQVTTDCNPVIEAAGKISTDPNELVLHWQAQLAHLSPLSSESLILGQLLTQQLQRQDEVWQRYSTHRKQAELAEALQCQNEELTNAIRFKDDFLNNVGQELRTPLTTIKTALTLLNSPSIKPPQRQRYMDLIAKECDRQSSLITSLLDLVHLDQVVEQSTLQPIRLSDLVPGVVSTYQPVAEEKGVKLAYTVPENLPPVSCMTNWLKQIAINLLHNGIKFTPSGGQVWVRAKQQGDYVQLEFRDTGIGIAPAEVPKIFERFYRVRQTVEESSGAGLGLTIVQQLLIHCGGSISVKSRLGEGSIFNVLLPIYRPPGDAAALEE